MVQNLGMALLPCQQIGLLWRFQFQAVLKGCHWLSRPVCFPGHLCFLMSWTSASQKEASSPAGFEFFLFPVLQKALSSKHVYFSLFLCHPFENSIFSFFHQPSLRIALLAVSFLFVSHSLNCFYLETSFPEIPFSNPICLICGCFVSLLLCFCFDKLRFFVIFDFSFQSKRTRQKKQPPPNKKNQRKQKIIS